LFANIIIARKAIRPVIPGVLAIGASGCKTAIAKVFSVCDCIDLSETN
jgi:hypothetical protein